MKQYVLKGAMAAIFAVTMHAASFAQEDSSQAKPQKIRDNDELIIKRKGDKDIKITVEVKDGQVFINGKQVDEFDDDNVSVQKFKHRDFDGDNFAMIAPDVRVSPFRGENWSYSSGGNAYSSNTASKSAFLGVTTDELEEGGVKITEISKASAAEKSGLKKGDIILKVDESKISTPEGLSKVIHKYKPEDKVTVTIKRDGKEQKVPAVLGKFKMDSYSSYSFSMPKMEEFSALGKMGAPRAMSWGGGPRIGIKAQDTEDGKGVKVLDIDDDSPADKAGIKEGDIITDFDGKTVNSADELAGLSKAAKEKMTFKIKFKRDNKAEEVEVKIPKKLKTTNL